MSLFSGFSTPATPANGLDYHPQGFSQKLSHALEQSKQFLEEEAIQRRSAIGGIDNMWLLLSNLTNFSPTCLSTYTLRGKLSREDLIKVIGLQADKFPRYKERLVDTHRRFHGPRFEADPHFNLENHIRTITLPGKASKTELDAAVGRFLSEEWDERRPLWDCLLVENYNDDEGCDCALITRGHHSMADGQGFVLSQLWITSFRPELEKMMDGGAVKLNAAAHGSLRPSQIDRRFKRYDYLADNAFTAPLLQLSLFALFWASQLMGFFEGLFWSLLHLIQATIGYMWIGWRAEYVTAGYRGERVRGKEFAASKTFPISDVKTIQKAFSGLAPGHWATRVRGRKTKVADKIWHITLNDVVCACMADVLGEEVAHVKPAQGLWPQFKYHFNRSFRPPIGLFIPISLRKPGQWDFRNLSVGANVWLKPSPETAHKPTADDLYHHIHTVQGELNVVKKSLLPQIMFNALQVSVSQMPVLWPFPGALLPGPIRTWLVLPLFRNVMSSFTGILTNVPGPAKAPVTLCNSEVARWTALPPQGEKSTIGIGVMTYAGSLSISVVADDVRDTRGVSRRICNRFEERFEEYLTVAKEVLGQSERNGYH